MGNDAEGNPNVICGVRGDIDVLLTNYINNCSEEDFERVKEVLEVDGLINTSKVSTKY